MLTIDQIKSSYPDSLHQFERGLLREYLQYQILSLIFNHKVGQKLSFLGGTNLRLVHGLPRFSEDIDFDNKHLSFEEFSELGDYLQRELERRGYLIENRFLNKEAFHCYIRFPELLYQQGLSPLEEEKILIQVDSFDQGVNYDPDIFLLNKFEFFDPIRTTPKEVILSQKLWTITQRKRLKGRDFFDLMFLLQNTKPNLDFLEAKFATRDVSEIKNIILGYVKDADFHQLATDVRPFLLNIEDSEKIKYFPQFFVQQWK